MRRSLSTSLVILFVILFLVDIGYSFVQYAHFPTDGDMPSHLLPKEEFQKVIDSPLGLAAFDSELPYPDPNRFFMHYPYYVVMNFLPPFFGKFVHPVDAIYLSMALVKTIVHVSLVILLGVFISGGFRFRELKFWGLMLVISAFFQANAYAQLGIVDSTITYVFGYSFQLIFVLLYFLPLLLKYYFDLQNSILYRIKILWIPLALVINLGSPLTPGIILVIVLLFAVDHSARFSKHKERSFKRYFSSIPNDYYFYLLPAALFAVYSLIIGMFNSNTILYAKEISLKESYMLLPYGVFNQYYLNKAYFFLGTLFIGGYLALWNDKTVEAQRYKKLFLWAIAFSLIYIALLPLGGYKPYRPYTLRSDTVLPVTLAQIILVGISIRLLIKAGFQSILQKGFGLFALVVLIGFYVKDAPEFWRNKKERASLMLISNATEAVVQVPQNTIPILNWEITDRKEQSKDACDLLLKWGVIDEPKRFYQGDSQQDVTE